VLEKDELPAEKLTGVFMRLTHVHITNYKSVEDSNEFTIGDVTCLVGKNEAGKSAILQALHTLKPDSGSGVFDAAKSYPRRHWSEYEEHDEVARVLRTNWTLDEKEIKGLEGILGPKGLTAHTVTISKSYDQTGTSWNTSVDEAAVAEFLLRNSPLHSEEKSALEQHKTVEKLKTALTTLGAQASERQTKFLSDLQRDFKRGSATLAVIDHLSIPTFFYFSSYDRMSGQVALEQLIQKKANKTLDKSDEVFLGLFVASWNKLRRHDGSQSVRADDCKIGGSFEPNLARDFCLLVSKSQPKSSLSSGRGEVR
jgi:AAA15 family ATPase/GTPase